jgi:hypothetical protein
MLQHFVKGICLAAILLLSSAASAQTKYGKVDVNDFNINAGSLDTTLGAIIITDEGTSYFEGNNKGWFTLVHKHYRRVKILSKLGFDAADVSIDLYHADNGNDEEKLDKLKACTYNLENGKVVETKVKDDAVFKEKRSANWNARKFTFPAVKPGSILEYSYTVTSDFLFNLQPWTFQSDYPCLWSSYDVSIPDFFSYVFLLQGYLPFDVADKKTGNDVFYVRQRDNEAFSSDQMIKLSTQLNINKWVMKNIPSIRNEKFLSTQDNYVSRIRFQLAAYRFPGSPIEEVMSSWPKVIKQLAEREDFGYNLSRNNNWMDDDLKSIVKEGAGEQDKAEQIYTYLQGFQVTGMGGIYLSKSLREILKSKSGKSQDINLLLTAMLRHVGLTADPVLLSTISNGRPNPFYPLMDRYNYVICRLMLNGEPVFLDASQSYLGFGKLPTYAYNGQIRIITKNEAVPLMLSPDMLSESKMTSVMLYNDEKEPGNWSGNFNVSYGYNESSNIRGFIIDKGKDAFIKKINDPFTGDFSVAETEIDNLDDKVSPIKVSRKLTIANSGAPSIIYFSPLMHEAYKENPFKAKERKFPVEFPYKTDEVFILKLEIPTGYEVDEMPKSEKATFNESDGFIEYIIEKSATEVNLRCRIKFEKATFEPEDYENIQAFFDYIVKKQAEKIVFKKKS